MQAPLRSLSAVVLLRWWKRGHTLSDYLGNVTSFATSFTASRRAASRNAESSYRDGAGHL